MHAVDLLAKSQEYDDKELKAWYNFYASCIRSDTDPKGALRSFLALYEGSKVDECLDAELLFHTCFLVAMILSDLQPEDNIIDWPFYKVRSASNGSLPTNALQIAMVPLHGMGGHSYDRVSHLLRSAPDPCAITLHNLARRLLNVYSANNASDRIQSSLSHICERLDLGKRFTKCFCLNSTTIILKDPLDSDFKQIDALLDSSQTAPTFLNAVLARLLSTGIKRNANTCVWKSLIRISRLRFKQGLFAQALLILDDIEEHVFANCNLVDWGLLFQTRAECFLKLAALSPSLPDPSPLLVDAFHNIQLSIACYDRAASITRLTRCVLMACLLAQKLKANPFTNFYAVKAAQIRSSMDCSVRFFPIEVQEQDDILNVLENTGQPKLPFANMHYPKTSGPVPTSPVGRGMQTLIAWRH